jgi:hypothetical protein
MFIQVASCLKFNCNATQFGIQWVTLNSGLTDLGNSKALHACFPKSLSILLGMFKPGSVGIDA